MKNAEIMYVYARKLKILSKSLLSIVIFLSLAVNCYALTFQEIIDILRLKLRDTGPSSTYRYSEAILIDVINSVSNEIVSHTQAIYVSTTITTVAEQAEYDLTNDILGYPQRVTYSIASSTNYHKRIDAMTLTEMDKNTNWDSRSSGRPLEYYIYNNKICLYPKPSSSYVNLTALQVDYIKDPADAVSGSLTVEPFDGIQWLTGWHWLIIDGVMVRLGFGDKIEYYTILDRMDKYIEFQADAFTGKNTYNQ